MSASTPTIRDWVIDADTHITEPGDLWTSRLPAKWKDRAPHIVRDDAGVGVRGVLRGGGGAEVRLNGGRNRLMRSL